MDLSSFFDSLADYLNFTIALLGLNGMGSYRLAGTISNVLIRHFVVGTITAYLIFSIKKEPGPSDHDESESGSVITIPIDMPDMAKFIVYTILNGITFHGLLLLYNSIFGAGLHGSIHDTINSVLAFNAVVVPLQVVTMKFIAFFKKLTEPTAIARIVKKTLLYLTLISFITAILVYYIYCFAAVHGLSMSTAISLYTGSVALIFAILVPIALIFPKDEKAEQ